MQMIDNDEAAKADEWGSDGLLWPHLRGLWSSSIIENDVDGDCGSEIKKGDAVEEEGGGAERGQEWV